MLPRQMTNWQLSRQAGEKSGKRDRQSAVISNELVLPFVIVLESPHQTQRLFRLN